MKDCNTPVTLADTVISLMLEIKDREQYIRDALEYSGGTHTFDDIVGMIAQGRVRWWPLPNSFLVTEVLEYPQAKHYHVFLAGGDLEEIKSTQKALEAAAEQCGCCKLTLSGRRGWIKALKDLNWKEYCTTVAYDIDCNNEN